MWIWTDGRISTRRKLNSNNESTRSLKFLSYNIEGRVAKLHDPFIYIYYILYILFYIYIL